VPEASDCAAFTAKTSPWCVLRTRPRKELDAIAALDALGVAALAPELRRCGHHRGKQRWTRRRMIPNYIFVQIDAHGAAREEARVPADGQRRKRTWEDIRDWVGNSLMPNPFMVINGGERAATVEQGILDKILELARELNQRAERAQHEGREERIRRIFGDLVRESESDDRNRDHVAFLIAILGREVKAIR
jgi:Transcription termination factor nusG